eukprot:15332495-Ditylum_brightwellii.AAC.1
MKMKTQIQINQLQFTTDEQCYVVLNTKACRSNNKVKHMGQSKYNDLIDTYYKKFRQTVTKITLENIASMYDIP